MHKYLLPILPTDVQNEELATYPDLPVFEYALRFRLP